MPRDTKAQAPLRQARALRIVHGFNKDEDVTPYSQRVYPWRVEVRTEDVIIWLEQVVDPGSPSLNQHQVCVNAEMLRETAGDVQEPAESYIDVRIMDFVQIKKFARALLAVVEAVEERHPELTLTAR